MEEKESEKFEEKIWIPKLNPDFYQIIDGKKVYQGERDGNENVE